MEDYVPSATLSTKSHSSAHRREKRLFDKILGKGKAAPTVSEAHLVSRSLSQDVPSDTGKHQKGPVCAYVPWWHKADGRCWYTVRTLINYDTAWEFKRYYSELCVLQGKLNKSTRESVRELPRTSNYDAFESDGLCEERRQDANAFVYRLVEIPITEQERRIVNEFFSQKSNEDVEIDIGTFEQLIPDHVVEVARIAPENDPVNSELRPVTASPSPQCVSDTHGKMSKGPVTNASEQNVSQIVRGFSFGPSNVKHPSSPNLYSGTFLARRNSRTKSIRSKFSSANVSLRSGNANQFDKEYQNPDFSKARTGSAASSYDIPSGSRALLPPPIRRSFSSVPSLRPRTRKYAAMFTLGASSEEDEIEYEAQMSSNKRPAKPVDTQTTKETFFQRLAKQTRAGLKDQGPGASDKDDDEYIIDDSAIEDDEDSGWEEEEEEEEESDSQETMLFKRVDSFPNLSDRRPPVENGSRGVAIPQVTSKQSYTFGYSPRTTRHQMLSTEPTESLRKYVLWERQKCPKPLDRFFRHPAKETDIGWCMTRGEPRDCYMCGETIRMIRARDWQRHVLDDLQPYQCLELDCPSSTETFARLWRLRAHYSSRHPNTALMSSTAQACPFCDLEIFGDAKDKLRHVGEHMEEVAFAVVPRQYEDWSWYSDSGSGGNNRFHQLRNFWNDYKYHASGW